MIIGIQGDQGSGNEYACQEFCKKRNIFDYKIKYLISTENVLRELKEGKIDLGTFAYKSLKGGLVEETQKAIKKYSFEKVDEITLPINHVLLGIKKLKKEEYTRIISHPHAIKEHRAYLEKAYANAQLIEAEDTALPARKLKEGLYDDKTLIIALKSCSKLYNLLVIEEDLPANKNFLTTFYLVKKKN
ncbi:prephenate dehydratase [archaeon]|nr:prephenate dehydratase [archaeon]